MERFWRIALGVAGIGAIGFFVFWSLYQRWLTLPIFPVLTQSQTFQLLRYFLFLTFGALTLAVVAYLFTYRRRQLIPQYVPIQSASLRLPNGSRFTDEQFDTYKQVWLSLQRVRKAGDALWQEASKEHLTDFAESLREAKELIDQGSIFFHPQDYSQLKQILRSFSNYGAGKEGLIDMRKGSRGITEFALKNIRARIARNRSHMDEYSKLLERIRESYHDRLSWRRGS